jgi:hypothetical protein
MIGISVCKIIFKKQIVTEHALNHRLASNADESCSNLLVVSQRTKSRAFQLLVFDFMSTETTSARSSIFVAPSCLVLGDSFVERLSFPVAKSCLRLEGQLSLGPGIQLKRSVFLQRRSRDYV